MGQTRVMSSDPTEAELLTIGRFSKTSRLSLKALRLYDAQGLLPPAMFDDDPAVDVAWPYLT